MKILFCLMSLVCVNAMAAGTSLMDACKKECPNATTDKEAHDCAEKIEHGKKAKSFKKSKCHEADEAYEQQNPGAAGEEGEKHE